MDWKVTVMTYNVNLRPPIGLLTEDLLGLCVPADILVVGLQEVTHAETMGSVAVSWARMISTWTLHKGKMILLTKTHQATNQVLVFVKKQLVSMVKRIDYRFARNTMGGFTGHKGSIGLRIQLRSPFSIVFVDSHFVHDVAAYDRRISQFVSNRHCSFHEDKSVRAAFWFGDLNFRVEEETDTVMKKIADGSYLDLLEENEQLKRAQKDGDAFVEFNEQPITFPPTYRLVVGTKEHDAKRTPSWCDRVLYKGQSVRGISYSANEKVLLSDHLPVVATFNVNMPVAPKADWEVVFEHLPTWYSSIPLIGRFQINDVYYKQNSSFRDWVGVYPADIEDCTSTERWVYFATCFQQTVLDEKYYVVEFSNLYPGTYRLGYFSLYLNCLVGLSKTFKVIKQP